MKWSRYQLAVFSELSLSDQNLLIEARAGSGKTKVIEECNRQLPDSMTVGNIAFNTFIVEEMRKRLPVKREVATLNSTGWGIIRSIHKGAQLNANKNYQYLASLFNLDNPSSKQHFQKISGAVRRTVSLFKALNLQSWPEDWVSLLDTYGVETGDFDEADSFPEIASEVFEYSINDLTNWDFDDQIYQVIRQNYPIKKKDIVFIDEAQDLSPVQIELVKRLGKRSIAVGDRNQSIYVFRGADLHAIDRIIEETNARPLPLSICYRCPKAVIREAQRYVPEIEWAEDAIEGVVESIKKDEFYRQLNGTELVTCRNVAPLVRECLRQLGRRQKAFVRGRDLGSSIYDLVDKVARIAKSDYLSAFLPALYQYRTKQVEKLMDTGREAEAETLQDKVDSIECFADYDGVVTVQDMFGVMNEVFSDENKTGTEYSTVHKSKGRECNTVYRLDPWLCPSPKTKPHLMPIETNILYVQITRAMKELFTIISEK